MIDKNEIKKDLYRTKAIAKLEYYNPENGDLIYNVEIFGQFHRFPIHTITKSVSGFNTFGDEVYSIALTDDLKGAKFEAEMSGSSLIRWIQQAIDNNEFF